MADFNWSNVTSTSYAQVTDQPLLINSSSTGNLKFEFYSAFSASLAAVPHNIKVIARYRAAGASSWIDVAGSEVDGSAAFEDPEFRTVIPGFVSSAGTITVATGANDASFEVALFARRIAGSSTITFASNDSVFRVTQ